MKMIADGDGTAKELEKLMVLPWRNLAGPLMLRRNELRANPQRSNAVIKFRELRDLQRYFMAVVDRPCGCATCEAQKRIRKALVSEGMTPSVPQNLDSELAKYAEKCERKSAIHQLELDDYYPSALICLNYAQLLRPKTEVQPQGDGQAKNLHPCVCELIWLRRRLPDDLITKVQTVWDLIDWCESWEDDLEPKIKAEKVRINELKLVTVAI